MNKCKNCTKFLTCNREQCKQITYLQAGQTERMRVKSEKKDFETLKEAATKVNLAFCDLANIISKELNKDFKIGILVKARGKERK